MMRQRANEWCKKWAPNSNTSFERSRIQLLPQPANCLPSSVLAQLKSLVCSCWLNCDCGWSLGATSKQAASKSNGVARRQRRQIATCWSRNDCLGGPFVTKLESFTLTISPFVASWRSFGGIRFERQNSYSLGGKLVGAYSSFSTRLTKLAS